MSSLTFSSARTMPYAVHGALCQGAEGRGADASTGERAQRRREDPGAADPGRRTRQPTWRWACPFIIFNDDILGTIA